MTKANSDPSTRDNYGRVCVLMKHIHIRFMCE